uniref:Ig-like domain-containing protein n=1 Tax=Chrysemys picta bellii TaxID=8478 RepID=A0A8C3IUL4_CHRPI
TGFFPADIRLRWEHNGSLVPASQYSNGPVFRSGQAYSAQSILRVPRSKGEGEAGPQYVCLVWHMTLNETLKVKVKPQNCELKLPKAGVISALNAASCPQPGGGNCNRHPLEVFLLPPSLEDLYIAQNATITCLVSGMETPGSLEVSWSRGIGGPLDVVYREPVLQENGTYSATSILRVCVEEWQAGEEFTSGTPDSPRSPLTLWCFLVAEVSPRNPSVYISPPHAEELSLRESATITCLASGFWPRDILVTWTQQDRPVPQEAYTNIGPVREAGKEELYFIYSKLNVLASEWQRGDTYACVVGHEGLPMTFIHRSVDKASGKPTTVNVSVILSDTDVTCY